MQPKEKINIFYLSKKKQTFMKLEKKIHIFSEECWVWVYDECNITA